MGYYDISAIVGHIRIALTQNGVVKICEADRMNAIFEKRPTKAVQRVTSTPETWLVVVHVYRGTQVRRTWL